MQHPTPNNKDGNQVNAQCNPRPECPGEQRFYRWNTLESRWEKRSPSNAKAHSERYRRHIGKKVVDDYTLFLTMRLRLYEGFDLETYDWHHKTEKWYRWVEHHNAAEPVFAQMMQAVTARSTKVTPVELEQVVIQNIVSNVPECNETCSDVVIIDLPVNARPASKLNYTVEKVQLPSEEKPTLRIQCYADEIEKQKMDRALSPEVQWSPRDSRELKYATMFTMHAETYGVYRPLRELERIYAINRKHSKFCAAPSLVNELIGNADPGYRELLKYQALGLPCNCLRYFVQETASRLKHEVLEVRPHFKESRYLHQIFDTARKKVLETYPVNTDPLFWLRTLMILRGSVEQNICDSCIAVSLEPGGTSKKKKGLGTGP